MRAAVTLDELRVKLRTASPSARRRKGTAVRYFLYRPEGLLCTDDSLGASLDWEADGNLSALIWLAVRLFGGAKKPEVFSLPVLEPVPGATYCRRALVLRAGGPTAILSPVRIKALTPFLAWSFTLRPSAAEFPPELFAERVARQAREVAAALNSATFAAVE
jgi:hypothetical protein